VYRGVSIDWKEDLTTFVAWRYGLSHADVLECCAWLSALPREPLYLVHPVLTRMMDVDLASTQERYAA
jgi:hypothetical protein